jgi:nitrate reductase gamma subunit
MMFCYKSIFFENIFPYKIVSGLCFESIYRIEIRVVKWDVVASIWKKIACMRVCISDLNIVGE